MIKKLIKEIIIVLAIIIIFQTLYSHLMPKEEQYIMNEVESKLENIEVYFNVEPQNTPDGKIKFNIETNLPNGMQLVLTLCNKSGYTAQSKVIIQNGEIISSEFSEHGSKLASGTHELKISSSAVKFYSDDVKKIIGSSGEFMTGRYIKYDSLFECNLIEAVFEVIV